MRERRWPGAFNARDLGGVPIDGGMIRPAVLFRSGQPQVWKPEGWREAAIDGVRRIVDLRDPSEPRGAAAGCCGIAYGFAPVEDPKLPEFRERFSPYLNHTDGYAEFASMFPDRVAAAVGLVLESGPGTVVCCSAGRDRTGLVLGVLLRALGAPLAALLHEDELATRAVNGLHRVRATPHPYERYLAEPELSSVVASRAEGLRRFFAEVDARELLGDHGVSAARLEAARAWLTADSCPR